jgi:hypothetical protein
MNPTIKILILTMLASNVFAQDSEKLYPITKSNLYGYIDNTGKTKIKPQFLSAGQFSEGLTPVRWKGTYGYINVKGKKIIPPKFDLALSFYKGLAKVYLDGKPFFIDKKGDIIFQHNYKSISEFGDNSFAIAITHTDKYGLINKSGNLIVDTAFSKIELFNNGILIVTGLNHNLYLDDSTEIIIYEKGVIDTLGNWIVKYGKYEDIGQFANNYAHVTLIPELQEEYKGRQGLIDKTGKYRFTVPSKKWRFDYNNDNFYQDIAVVSIYAVDPDTVEVWSSKKRYDYKGAINSNGEIILSNADWDEITPFTFNRAFSKNTNGEWFLIDTKGKPLISQPFKEILYETYDSRPDLLFQDGIAFVKTEKGWAAIDTTGEFTLKPTDLNNIEYDYVKRRGSIIFLLEDISVESDKYAYRYGFWNTENNTIVKPRFHDIDMDGFDSDLIYFVQDEQAGYINTSGKQIWKEQNKAVNKQLNIDYMNRGYFYASSKYKKGLAGFGGWGSSDNSSKQISADGVFLPNTFQIVIDPGQRTKWADKYDAIKLFVANTSGDTLYFDAQDSRLYLKIQAQDRKGEWKDIEYLPRSWCGNSYHSLFLAPNELWEFATPVYQGEFKTKIRAQLLFKKSQEQEIGDIIYSNEIDGHVNPGQFWHKREYYPGGLMDPYND